MTTEPAFYVGILLLVTGVACGGVGALLGRRYALIIVGGIPFLVAGALLVYIARERHRFRVTEVAMSAVSDYSGPCPGRHRVGIRVSTAGGAGRVTFRVWANDDYDAPVQTVQVRPGREFEYMLPVRVAQTGLATAYASVETPNVETSSAVFRVACAAAR